MRTGRQVRLTISGNVQGVWYRAWAMESARELGLDGWVRNRRDGSVEIALRGPSEKVATMIDRCHSGPPRAEVTDVHVAEDSEDLEQGFRQRPTA